MKSIIRELYWGNINGSAQSVEPNSQYQKAMEIMIQKEEEMLKILSEEDKELFLSFVKSQTDLNDITGDDKFSLGFIIGARIMLEVMSGKAV